MKRALITGITGQDGSYLAELLLLKSYHEYLHIAGGQQGAYWGEEARRNLAIYSGVPHTHTLLDASHELLEDGRIRPVRFRCERAAIHRFFWKAFVQPTVGIRKKLGLN